MKVIPSRMGTEQNQVGPGSETLIPYRIQVKTLFNLSISISQMSSLLFDSFPQEICFLRTACLHCKKFIKGLFRVIGYVASHQPTSTPLTNDSGRKDSFHMSSSSVSTS